VNDVVNRCDSLNREPQSDGLLINSRSSRLSAAMLSGVLECVDTHARTSATHAAEPCSRSDTETETDMLNAAAGHRWRHDPRQ